jgi:RNA polymerase sigma-70 factor (ECF subfamily)
MPAGGLLPLAAARTMSLDDEAFDRLYQRQAETLLDYFQRRLQDPELATDLVADTFEAVLERRSQYRGDSEEEESGWLWRIASSTLREHERRGRARRRDSRGLIRQRRALTDSEIERIEDDASSERMRRAVRDSLDRLPDDQRDAVRLRVVESLPYDEVARRLGIQPTAARVRVLRAMRVLRGMLSNLFEEEEDS